MKKSKKPLFTSIYWKLSLISIFTLFLYSCGGDDENEPIDEFANSEFVTSATFIETTSETTIQAIAGSISGFSSIATSVDFKSVDAYKIAYRTTDVSGNNIEASGLVMFPVVNAPLPIISYQHGTLTDVDDAPSNFAATSEVVINIAMSSAGYAVILPDYIGYGNSSDQRHPYQHATSLGSSSYHMLMAAKEFFDIRNISTSDKLFLTGYSEGGFATMALHQHIERNSNLQITMSAPAAGAYNTTAFSLDVISRNENLNFLTTYVWVLDSYNWIYNINRPWEQLVSAQDAAVLNQIQNPMNISSANISSNPQELFLSSFIEGIQNVTDTEVLAALSDNDIFDWNPVAPIRLYHGTDDDFVFPLNSRTAFNALNNNGADVELIEFEGKDHGTATTDYILAVFELFESLK